jgi:hypothetical protein
VLEAGHRGAFSPDAKYLWQHLLQLKELRAKFLWVIVWQARMLPSCNLQICLCFKGCMGLFSTINACCQLRTFNLLYVNSIGLSGPGVFPDRMLYRACPAHHDRAYQQTSRLVPLENTNKFLKDTIVVVVIQGQLCKRTARAKLLRFLCASVSDATSVALPAQKGSSRAATHSEQALAGCGEGTSDSWRFWLQALSTAGRLDELEPEPTQFRFQVVAWLCHNGWSSNSGPLPR